MDREHIYQISIIGFIANLVSEFLTDFHEDVPQHVLAIAILAIAPIGIVLGMFDNLRLTGR